MRKTDRKSSKKEKGEKRKGTGIKHKAVSALRREQEMEIMKKEWTKKEKQREKKVNCV